MVDIFSVLYGATGSTVFNGTTTNANIKTDVAQRTVLGQMQAQQQAQFQKESAKVSNEYQTEINAVQRDQARLEDLKDEIGAASTFLSKMVAYAKSSLSNIDATINLVISAEQQEANDGDPGNYATTFDNFLKRLEDNTETGGVTSNLMSRREADYYYTYSQSGGQQTVYANYLGVRYQIEDENGKIWVPDYEDKLLRQYTHFPDTPTDVNYSLETGFELSSLSGSDVTFVINPESGSPETLNGTLSEAPLPVLSAWMYDDLLTADGRTRAKADLYDAKTAVEIEIARYEAAFKLAQLREERVHEDIQGIKGEVNDLTIERAQELQELQNKLSLEYQVANARVQAALSQRFDYAFMLSSLTSGNTAAQTLFTLIA